MGLKEIIEKLEKGEGTDIYFSYTIWTEIDSENIMEKIKNSGHKVKDIVNAYDKFGEIVIEFNDDTEIEIKIPLPEEPEYKRASAIEIVKN